MALQPIWLIERNVSAHHVHQSTFAESFLESVPHHFKFLVGRWQKRKRKHSWLEQERNFCHKLEGGRWEPNSSPNRLPEKSFESNASLQIDHLDSPLSAGKKPCSSQTLHYIVQARKPSQTGLSVILSLKSRFKYSKDRSCCHSVSVQSHSSSLKQNCLCLPLILLWFRRASWIATFPW